MISRLEFLKLIGLGALASKVPWKWQEGTPTERLKGEEVPEVIVDDPVLKSFRSDWQAFDTEWPHVRWIAPGFRVKPEPTPRFMTLSKNGEWLEVSLDEKVWYRIPDGAEVEIYTDHYAIEIDAGLNTYRQRTHGEVSTTVRVPTTIEWPTDEWRV